MPPSQLPFSLQVIQALALPAIALLGALIAYQQMRIAGVKLNHDLYDRRFRIYEVTAALMKKIGGEVKIGEEVTQEDIDVYWREVSHAPFLSIGDDLVSYLSKVRSKADYHVNFDTHNGNTAPLRERFKYHMMYPHPSSMPQPERDEVVAQMKRMLENKKWFTYQQDELVRRFMPLLQLEKPPLFHRLRRGLACSSRPA
jgi:hypothetical protein